MNLNDIVSGIKSGSSLGNPLASVSSTLGGTLSSLTGPTTLTGSITGIILTVTAITGAIVVGQTLTGTGVTSGTTISSFGTGTGGVGTYNVNHSQAITSSSLTASSAAQAAVGGISSALAGAQSQMSGFLSNIQSKLPLMAAADKVEKMLKAAQGIVPAGGAGSALTSIMAPMTAISSHLSDMHTTLVAHASNLTSSVPADATAAIAAVNGASATASANIASSFAGSSSAMSDAMSNVKSFAMAKYVSLPQPPQIAAITAQVYAAPPDLSMIKMDIAAGNTTIPTSPPDITTPLSFGGINPAPSPAPSSDAPTPTTVCSGTFDAFKNSYFAHLQSVAASCKAYQDAYENYLEEMNTWERANFSNPSYSDLQDAALNTNDPANKAAWAAAQNKLKTQWANWGAYQQSNTNRNNASKNYQHLLKQWSEWARDGSYGNHCDSTTWDLPTTLTA